MYNEVEINKLISLIQRYDGIGDKEKLSRIVQGEFGLIKDRRVFSDATADFAIRFSMSKRKKNGQYGSFTLGIAEVRQQAIFCVHSNFD